MWRWCYISARGLEIRGWWLELNWTYAKKSYSLLNIHVDGAMVAPAVRRRAVLLVGQVIHHQLAEYGNVYSRVSESE